GRHGVVAVRCLGDRVRVRVHRDGPDEAGAVAARVGGTLGTGGRGAATGAAGQRVQADVHVVAGGAVKAGAHEHGVARGVGDIGRGDRVAVRGVGGDDRARHAAGIGDDPVGHVTG